MSVLITDQPAESVESNSEASESPVLDLPIQMHSRPPTPRVVVTNEVRPQSSEAEKLEYDSDERILQQAQELGIEVPPEPKPEGLDLEKNSSTATVSSSGPDTNTVVSRNSQSTRPTSYNSSEQQVLQRISSPSTLPSTPTHSRSRSAAPSSTSSTERTPYSKIRKSIRRLSTLTRRLSTAPSPPSLFPEQDSFIGPLRNRPGTAQSTRGSMQLQPRVTHQMSAMVLPSLSESRLSAIYPPSVIPTQFQTDFEREQKVWAARERSVRCGRLQRLRIHQLEQQSEFLKYHFEAIDKIRATYGEEKHQATTTLKEKQESMQARHAERNADVETRHLAAEIDLTESLENERRACETKLKHMDAYCNNRQTVAPDGQRRKITEEDFRKLVEQYNIRNGLDALHESRINVLREQQAKQLERIAARQDAELQALQDQVSAELDRKEEARQKEEAELKKDFEFKKDKMIWRWKVMEAVERRRLELERGEEYGELPEVQWAEEGWLNAAL